MPRLLFLLTTSDWGGVQFFVLSLAQEAVQRGYEVRVAAGGEGELEAHCRSSRIGYTRIVTMKRGLSPLTDLAALHEIRKLMREFKPDVVHLNSSKMGVIGSMAAQLERVPKTVYRIGGWSFLEDQPTWKKKIYLLAEKWTAAKKDVIVTVHPGDEQIARKEKILPRGLLLTIPNGINLSHFDSELLPRAEARRLLDLEDNDFALGTVANFYPPKNLVFYLEALAPLLKKNEKIRPVILGDGPERERIMNRLNALGLENKVRLLGRRSNASRLLSAFDIFILPSSKEGMPWALLEAMAARLPCIATDVGACKWMLADGEAGLIISPSDAMPLQQAILELMQSQNQREHLGNAARREVETRFRWETTLEKTMEII